MLERLTVAATLVVRHAALIFAIAMACLLAIALTWNTVARLWTIAGLLCLFLLATLLAYLRVRGLGARSRPLFARTARAWEQDRMLFEKLLGDDATRPHVSDDV
jgi:hypothetical protein